MISDRGTKQAHSGANSRSLFNVGEAKCWTRRVIPRCTIAFNRPVGWVQLPRPEIMGKAEPRIGVAAPIPKDLQGNKEFKEQKVDGRQTYVTRCSTLPFLLCERTQVVMGPFLYSGCRWFDSNRSYHFLLLPENFCFNSTKVFHLSYESQCAK